MHRNLNLDLLHWVGYLPSVANLEYRISIRQETLERVNCLLESPESYYGNQGAKYTQKYINQWHKGAANIEREIMVMDDFIVNYELIKSWGIK